MHALLNFVNNRRKKKLKEMRGKRQSHESELPHCDHGNNNKKNEGNYLENKLLPFASQLKNNKSKKWPVAEHLNTHINHKNSYTAPWQCIATVQNFSQGERRQKNTLLLLTPASHFGLQRFWSAAGHVSAVFREMTCLRTNTAMFCSTAAPSIPAQFLFNPFLPSLTLTHCNRELTPSTMLSHCSASHKPRQIRPAFSRANTLTPRLIWLLNHVMALDERGAGKRRKVMWGRGRCCCTKKKRKKKAPSPFHLIYYNVRHSLHT